MILLERLKEKFYNFLQRDEKLGKKYMKYIHLLYLCNLIIIKTFMIIALKYIYIYTHQHLWIYIVWKVKVDNRHIHIHTFIYYLSILSNPL